MAQLGDPSTALQISSGTLWLWLIPIVLGYISCGTQATDHSIEDAISNAHETAYCAPEPPHNTPMKAEQQGLMVRPGLSPQLFPHHTQAQGFFNTPNALRLETPPWMGASVGGDEELKGPIFNYARLFTWSQLAQTFRSAFTATLQNISEKLCTDKGPSPPMLQNLGPHGLTADSKGTAKYCGIGTNGIKAYAKWGGMRAEVYRRIIGASCAALFLQWGTTGASVLIAYTTPTVGLGYRSGSYLLYGGVATLAWLFLMIATLFSHAAMLRYQSEHVLDPFKQFQRDPSNNPNTNTTAPQQNVYERDFSHSALCGAAVLFRYLGKTLCVLNTALLIIGSLMEFTGGYNNCWCEGNAFGMGSKGWVVLFKNSSDLAAAASLPWVGGLVMTIVVCVASYGFFWLGSSKT
ncbi:hypothetical protein B0A48_08018 [Cryoendolithus antarcticus]|uniref:Uncharacterized protein n=1 Tax=Cryoendolithus antarcticus TaxID=1507870 RepID=A0A1V8T111_9PEZI|nr:hypothetical protein B0A48_08018 [Cryoendolithus antarcticus]